MLSGKVVKCEIVNSPRCLIDVPSSIRSTKVLCHILGMKSGCKDPLSLNLTSDERCHRASNLGA